MSGISVTINKQLHFSHFDAGEPVFRELDTITASHIERDGERGYAYQIPLEGDETQEMIELLKRNAVACVERALGRSGRQIA